MFQKLVPFCTTHRNTIIHLFQLGYALLVLVMFFATWAFLSGSPISYTLYTFGSRLGQASLVLFIIVTLPGILGRFGVQHPLIPVGIMFRRHTGISMFMVALLHALVASTLPTIAIGGSLLPEFGYELFGMLSLAILTPLFLTSNMYSMKKLGKNWKRIHKLIYVAFWLIMIHVGLQGDKTWTLLIAITGLLEVVSLFIDWRKKSASVIPVNPSNTGI